MKQLTVYSGARLLTGLAGFVCWKRSIKEERRKTVAEKLHHNQTSESFSTAGMSLHRGSLKASCASSKCGISGRVKGLVCEGKLNMYVCDRQKFECV